MLETLLQKQQAHRKWLRDQFPYRKDAILNLLDALMAEGHLVKSVIELCRSKFFTRKYSSITDAISDGLTNQKEKVNWKKIFCSSLLEKVELKKQPYHRFVMDCTSNKRAYSSCLKDRSIQYSPNQAPGNKPICVGHQYSLLAYMTNQKSSERKNWIYPLDMRRVRSDQKGPEVGMQQLQEIQNGLEVENEPVLSIGDSSYGNKACRKQAASCPSQLHLFRLRNNRNVFKLEQETAKKKVGRPKRYGKKMTLNQTESFLPFDQQENFLFQSKSGKEVQVTATCFEEIILRGSNDFDASKHPIRMIRYRLTDKEGKEIFTRPLWLAAMGSWRKDLSLKEYFFHYHDRYDIEHYFRFSKKNLLLDQYQSSEIENEEAWWKLVALAYLELAFLKEQGEITPKAWEKYLPQFQKTKNHLASPSQLQRGYSTLLDLLGSPAKDPIPRGNPMGRKKGVEQTKREKQNILFKGKKKIKLSEGLKKDTKNSNLKKTLKKFVAQVKKKIEGSNFSIEEVFEQILPNK